MIPPMMSPQQLGLVILVLLLPVALFLMKRTGAKKQNPRHTVHLLKFFLEARPCRIYLGVPPEGPIRWEKVYRLLDQEVVVTSGKVYPLEENPAYIIAYPSGEIAHFSRLFYPLPAEVFFMERVSEPVPDEAESTLTLEQLQPGREMLKVTYSKSLLFPDDRHYVTTTLTNRSKQRIKITRFAAYRMENGNFTLQTATGGFFSERQFKEWYGQTENEWIEPGQRIFDPHCFGKTGTLWVYFGITENNEPWMAGEVT